MQKNIEMVGHVFFLSSSQKDFCYLCENVANSKEDNRDLKTKKWLPFATSSSSSYP